MIRSVIRKRALMYDLSCAPNGEVLLEDPNNAGVYSALNLKSFGRDLFDGVPKPNELRFTLRGWSTADAVHVVQCYTADLAFDDSFVARPHREFEHHAVGIVTDDTAPREQHI
jgi:hypothetical protein